MIKVIAKEFIILHIKKKNFNLENYIPEGQLEGFPKEIIKRILDCQEEQGNKKDISVFEENKFSLLGKGGFDWAKTKEKWGFWYEVISCKNFNVFFEKYPKKEDSQVFRVGDKVYDIMCKSFGIIINVNTDEPNYQLTVNLENGNHYTYTIDGRINHYYKTPQLLHYRDDYDYTTIDFKNLPKRQEKRWRAKEGGIYYFIKRDDYDSELDRVCETKDYYSYISNEQYKIGNYFQIKEEAQEVADKLNRYFKQLIKEEHEHERNKI